MQYVEILLSILNCGNSSFHPTVCQLLFTNCIVDTLDPGSGGLPARLQLLLEKTTEAVYRAVSRGLFERHKLPFAFMLCTGILRATGDVSNRPHRRYILFHQPSDIVTLETVHY